MRNGGEKEGKNPPCRHGRDYKMFISKLINYSKWKPEYPEKSTPGKTRLILFNLSREPFYSGEGSIRLTSSLRHVVS